MRLIRTDIRTEELEACRSLLGTPGSVVEDDDLETARAEVSRAIDVAENGDGTYQENLEDANRHAATAHTALLAFDTRVRDIATTGRLRISTDTQRTILVALGQILDSLDSWLAWADRELRTLD